VTYREPPPGPRPFRVVHGPFRIRWSRFLVGLLLVTLGGLIAVMGMEHQSLECGPGPDAWCVLTAGTFGTREVARFPRRDLGSVRVDTRWGGKGNRTEYGRPVLMVGARPLALRETNADRAREFAGALVHARDRGLAFDAELRESRWVWVFGMLMLAAGLSAGRGAFVGAGRVSIDVDPNQRVLRVQRRLLGIHGRTIVQPISEIADVTIEHISEKDFWRGRHEPARELGRLVLVSTNGERRPLTAQSFPGRVVHLRAAIALLAGFGLPATELEKELAELELVRQSPRWAEPLGPLLFVSIGAPIGFLIGMAIFGVVGLAIGAFRAEDAISTTALAAGGAGAVAGVLLMRFLARPRPLA
jgi:hypothetical protein